MAVWKFQLLPGTPGILGERFHIDETMQRLADEVNDALRYLFRFHGVNKIVIELGPQSRPAPSRYTEALGVGILQFDEFDLVGYRAWPSERKRESLKSVVIEVFDWLITSYDDSSCFVKAMERLGWKGESNKSVQTRPTSRPV